MNRSREFLSNSGGYKRLKENSGTRKCFVYNPVYKRFINGERVKESQIQGDLSLRIPSTKNGNGDLPTGVKIDGSVKPAGIIKKVSENPQEIILRNTTNGIRKEREEQILKANKKNGNGRSSEEERIVFVNEQATQREIIIESLWRENGKMPDDSVTGSG